MEKLQYDSFYKFLVSAGVIMITGPCFGLYYLISGTFNMIINKEDYFKLSNYSRQLIYYKSLWLNKTFTLLPAIFVAILIMGVVFLVWGCIRWSRIQKVQDDGLLYDTQKKFVDIYKSTPEDVVLKILEKYALEHKDILTSNGTIINLVNTLSNLAEQNEPNLSEKAIEVIQELKSYASKKGTKIIRSDVLSQRVRAENDYFKYIGSTLKDGYTVVQNLSFDSYYYDIIAMSKKKQKDIIFEIFYDETSELRDAVITKKARRLNGAANRYIHSQNRKASPVLAILTKEAIPESRQAGIKNLVSRIVYKAPDVDVQFLTLEQIRLKSSAE